MIPKTTTTITALLSSSTLKAASKGKYKSRYTPRHSDCVQQKVWLHSSKRRNSGDNAETRGCITQKTWSIVLWYCAPETKRALDDWNNGTRNQGKKVHPRKGRTYSMDARYHTAISHPPDGPTSLPMQFAPDQPVLLRPFSSNDSERAINTDHLF